MKIKFPTRRWTFRFGKIKVKWATWENAGGDGIHYTCWFYGDGKRREFLWTSKDGIVRT